MPTKHEIHVANTEHTLQSMREAVKMTTARFDTSRKPYRIAKEGMELSLRILRGQNPQIGDECYECANAMQIYPKA